MTLSPADSQRIADIERRLAAIVGFAYQQLPDVTWRGVSNTLAELNDDGTWRFWDMRAPYSDEACTFIAHAPDDLRALLALVRRLSAG